MLRLRKIKWLPQGHMANKCKMAIFEPTSINSKPGFPRSCPIKQWSVWFIS